MEISWLMTLKIPFPDSFSLKRAEQASSAFFSEIRESFFISKVLEILNFWPFAGLFLTITEDTECFFWGPDKFLEFLAGWNDFLRRI